MPHPRRSCRPRADDADLELVPAARVALRVGGWLGLDLPRWTMRRLLGVLVVLALHGLVLALYADHPQVLGLSVAVLLLGALVFQRALGQGITWTFRLYLGAAYIGAVLFFAVQGVGGFALFFRDALHDNHDAAVAALKYGCLNTFLAALVYHAPTILPSIFSSPLPTLPERREVTLASQGEVQKEAMEQLEAIRRRRCSSNSRPRKR